ncbi:MAG: UvrD-helicase domain-containing protein [Flavobacteriaceae bacterium]
MENYLQLLNEAQQKPTVHKDGPLMVIAGAGSGKTRVLTYRIAYLMQQGVDAFSILALTFTNKAAREMKERIAQIVGDSETKIYGWERSIPCLLEFFEPKQIDWAILLALPFTTPKILNGCYHPLSKN